MILEQIYLGCLSQASYLIADEESKVACVVDPRRDVETYVERAEAHGWRIGHVILTPFHADLGAGHIAPQPPPGLPTAPWAVGDGAVGLSNGVELGPLVDAAQKLPNAAFRLVKVLSLAGTPCLADRAPVDQLSERQAHRTAAQLKSLREIRGRHRLGREIKDRPQAAHMAPKAPKLHQPTHRIGRTQLGLAPQGLRIIRVLLFCSGGGHSDSSVCSNFTEQT